MSLGNPQSFNRFSYVTNDPLNLVDPSGLDDEVIPPNVTVTVNIPPYNWYDALLSLYFGGLGRELYLPEGIGDPPGVVGVGPGEPANEKTDCEKFADEVDRLAAAAKSARDFINKLWSAFANQDLSKITSGFRAGFTDNVGPGNSPNQVRHTTGAIYTGYEGGSAYWTARVVTIATSPAAGAIINSEGLRNAALATTLDVFNQRERTYDAGGQLLSSTPTEAADMRLNGVAVPIGFQLGNGEINRNQVGNLIRRDICN